MQQGFITETGAETHCLVVIFLRGGADGLSMVVPVEDDSYYRARPLLAIAKKDTIRLDGFFGLHPELAPLEGLYHDGALSFVHGAGSEDGTRSHFEAQDFMEHGGFAGGGWLGRYLRYRSGEAAPLGAVAIGKTAPESMRGAPSTFVMESFSDFAFGEKKDAYLAELAKLYGSAGGAIGKAGEDTMGALKKLQSLNDAEYAPRDGATYPTDSFGNGLRQIAQMIRADMGLVAASIDLGGWDSHFAQGSLMEPRMRRLSQGLAAIHKDLGAQMERTTVVVMTEFGRRVYENASYGTDHGRGGVMFVMGGGISGGRVFSEWNGLEEDTLEGPGDLPVQHNYRNVLAPILSRHGAGASLSRVFPDYELDPLPLYA